MRTTYLTAAVAAAALFAVSGTALAQTAVTATTDLNVRAGPGPQYPVVGVIGINEDATLTGCAEGSQWCTVTFAGGEGWVFSDYLVAEFDAGAPVVVTERPADAVPIARIEETAPVGGATAGLATGAIAGAIIGGPIGAAVGGIAGAATGSIVQEVVEPTPEVVTYVQQNPMEPVYLDGEVVVGASLPDTVVVQPVPEYEYSYVYVNGQPVLVEPESRRIVYVVR